MLCNVRQEFNNTQAQVTAPIFQENCFFRGAMTQI